MPNAYPTALQPELAAVEHLVPRRILARITVEADTGCWRWDGEINENGYGRTDIGERRARTHRLIYQLVVGPIAPGQELDHLCRNRACCNPAHLEAVSHTENMRRGIWANMTHCIRGHAFTPENTYYRPDNSRECRICKGIRFQRYYARRTGLGI